MIEAALASQLAGLLAPFLPKLMETATAAGKKAVDTLAGKTSEAAWNKAVSAWNILRPEVEKEPELAKAVRDVAQNAKDPDAKVALAWQLKKLTLQPEMLSELQKIIAESKSDIRITTADRGGVAVGGSVTGGTIIAGYHKTYIKPEE